MMHAWFCLLLGGQANAITTGGHVLKGAVMENRMVDMQVNVHVYVRHRKN